MLGPISSRSNFGPAMGDTHNGRPRESLPPHGRTTAKWSMPGQITKTSEIARKAVKVGRAWPNSSPLPPTFFDLSPPCARADVLAFATATPAVKTSCKHIPAPMESTSIGRGPSSVEAQCPNPLHQHVQIPGNLPTNVGAILRSLREHASDVRDLSTFRARRRRRH